MAIEVRYKSVLLFTTSDRGHVLFPGALGPHQKDSLIGPSTKKKGDKRRFNQTNTRKAWVENHVMDTGCVSPSTARKKPWAPQKTISILGANHLPEGVLRCAEFVFDDHFCSSLLKVPQKGRET